MTEEEKPSISDYIYGLGYLLGSSIKRGLMLGVESAKSLRPLSKKEALYLKKVSYLLDDLSAKIIARRIKQGKCKIKFHKLGLSFLIAADDLQPILVSELEEVKTINKRLAKIFQSELQQRFSERAWQVIQEYVGANVLGARNIKKILTLLLFSDRIKVNIKLPKQDEKNLKWMIDQIAPKSLIKFNSKSKNFDLVFEVEPRSSNQFTEMAKKIIACETYRPSKQDIKFIKRYVAVGLRLSPKLPPNLADKVKRFIFKLKENENNLPYQITEGTFGALLSLLKASARLELRSEIQAKDLERIFMLLMPTAAQN